MCEKYLPPHKQKKKYKTDLASDFIINVKAKLWE